MILVKSQKVSCNLRTYTVMTTVTQSIHSGISWIGSIVIAIIIRCIFFLPFHWPRAHHMTCKELPTNKCFTANNFCSCIIKFKLRSCVKMADRFPKQVESDLTYFNNCWSKERWSNDKTIIIELGLSSKISWFVSGEQK